MADLLNGSPSGTQMSQATPDDGPELEDGEEHCTPEQEAALHKVMALVFHGLNDPKKLQFLEAQMHRAPNLGIAIGNITFMLLMTVYDGAKHAGQKLDPEVFLAQGGAVYQVIDRLLMLAEHIGLHPNPDQTREDALGACLDRIREHQNELVAPGSAGQRHVQMGQQQQMLAANPMSAAVSQGLQQQGLMGGQS